MSDADVNKLVVAFPTARSAPYPLSKPQLQKQAEQISASLQTHKQNIKQDVDVVEVVKGFADLTLTSGTDGSNNNNNAPAKKKKKNKKKK